MLEYCLRHEDYWMKTLQTVYPHGLNEKTKFMNKYVPVDNFFSPMSRYGERFLNVRTRNNIDKRILPSDISAFFNYIKQFPIKSPSNECRKLLESFMKSEL